MVSEEIVFKKLVYARFGCGFEMLAIMTIELFLIEFHHVSHITLHCCHAITEVMAQFGLELNCFNVWFEQMSFDEVSFALCSQ